MNSFIEHIQGEKPVLIDFFATWCGPCQAMPPILKDVKSHFGNSITILKVDVDKNPELAQHYQIRGVPALMIFKKGQVLWKQSGVMQAAALIETLKSMV
jgi:thioredoxin 1